MIGILSAEKIREADAYTIAHEPIASIDLMERACNAFMQWFTSRFTRDMTISIIAGTGNNGGDALGIARMLTEKRYLVRTYVAGNPENGSSDFKVNYQRLEREKEIISIEDDLTSFNTDIIIDGLFGSGLSRPPEGIYARIIDQINAPSAIRVAIDIPSGLFADKTSTGAIVRAQHTVSFQRPKLAFFMPENFACVGEWQVVDIGLNENFLQNCKTPYYTLTKKGVKFYFSPREKFSHKGTYGHGLLIGGSYGKIGAMVLAARATLRSGIGLLTAFIPHCGYEILQTACPEAMVIVDEKGERELASAPDTDSYSALGIGPGMGTSAASADALKKILTAFHWPVVLDADGLNLVAEHRELLALIPEKSILTPHPGEFRRLVGPWENDFQRLDLLRDFATKYRIVVVLKGAHSIIADVNGNLFFNNTGNPGMATGGSGDVLTGILTALLAQGLAPLQAAQAGVYLHGLAGDHAAAKAGQQSLIASDIIDALPVAFAEIGV